MSRRKRKTRKAKPATPEATRVPAETVGTQPPRSPGRQPLLFLLALVLLIGAVYLNVMRLRQGKLAPPLPFPDEVVSSRPFTPVAKGAGFVRLAPEETGVRFTHPVVSEHPRSYLYFSSMASGGTAIGDVNNDGRPDLFVASGPSQNRLYLQTEQAFRFTDVTDAAGVGGGGNWSCGVTMVDINADGRLDLYVANYDAPNQLFVNLGNGRFRESAHEYGLNITDASLEGVFADYDRDGDLDLYLVTYRFENPEGMLAKPPVELVSGEPRIQPAYEKYYEVTPDTIGYGIVGRSDGLLRNDGNGTFTNVTEEAGIVGAGHGQSASWWDYDQDGWVDLFVGNDFNDADRLYRNQGDGTFANVIDQVVPHTTWFSMGNDFGDVDGDGLPDLISTDMSSTTHFKQKTTMGSMSRNREFLETAVPRQYMRNALLLNSGRNRFAEAAYLTELDSTDWTWSVQLLDLNCDGRLDVFFTNGSVRSFTDSDRTLTLSQRVGKTEWDIYRDTEPLRERNLAFVNQGDLSFEEVSEAWGLDHLGVSMSSAYGDFDGDGDLDLVVAHVDEPLAIYRNDLAAGQRITLRLHGQGANRFGVGSQVRARWEGGELVRTLQPSRGFLASNQPIVHLGCGDASEVELEIRWPDGSVQAVGKLATGRHYEVKQQATPASSASVEQVLYTDGALPSDMRHRENEFDDYALQPLLPHRLSRLGPSLAMADVDGDGDEDLFLGGALGQPGMVWLRDADGFRRAEQPALDSDRSWEDLGAVWVDVEGDGDPDLVVASGGNEGQSGQYPLRAYRNQGGRLVRDESLVPSSGGSAGPVAAADADGDGDVDLFVGGRQVPGAYPLPGQSRLLLNEEGKFQDRTREVAPGLAEAGMVTGALWTDIDNDRDLDLLITTEWGPIGVWKQTSGTWAEVTAETGLAAYRGWWTGISAGDFDADGDLDYVATNLGLNTKYHANDEHPYRIYYGDFEGNGKRKLVEAEFEDTTLFPVRGKSCSTHAMPSLAERFPTYREFAMASLEDIYTTQCLDDSFQVSGNWLSSSLLFNDGEGRFTLQTLPRHAQLSPGFGVAVGQFVGDAAPDVLISQNFFSPQPETGNMDGGLGCLLEGQGNGQFVVVPARRSGVLLPQDNTALVVMDVNGDEQADFLVAANDASPQLLVSQSENRAALHVKLEVPCLANIAGTRVRLMQDGSPAPVVELSAGAGYLSQAGSDLFLGRSAADKPGILQVQWNDGATSEFPVAAGTRRVRVTRPEKSN